jgi:hypothetical protein
MIWPAFRTLAKKIVESWHGQREILHETWFRDVARCAASNMLGF